MKGLKPKARKTVRVQGHIVPLELIEKSPVEVGVIRKRLRYGWSLEDALNKPKVWNTEYITVQGRVITREQLDDALKLGITESHIRQRIPKGWSVENALTKPLGSRNYVKSDTQEMLEMLGRMKYLNRVHNAKFNPKTIFKRLNITWEDVKEIKVKGWGDWSTKQSNNDT